MERPYPARTDRLYALERTGLSRKPDELAKLELETLHSRGEVGPALILKDPYILDFLNLKDHYLERDFEDAILREMELFYSN